VLIDSMSRVAFTEVAFGPEGRRRGRRDFTLELPARGLQPTQKQARKR